MLILPREHLLRRHMLSRYRCTRCCEDFGNRPALHLHLRASEACLIRDDVQEEGIDDVQERQLRSRRKEKSGKGEEERWADIFRILFPDEDNIPCPCK
jgi:hypothetical protein